MRPRYMLDFKGRGSEVSDDTMKQVAEDVATPGALAGHMGRMGSLPTQIDGWLKDRGLAPSDRGMGGDRWHIGIPFESATEAMDVMQRAEYDFKDAISRGWLSLYLMTWSREPLRADGGAGQGG